MVISINIPPPVGLGNPPSVSAAGQAILTGHVNRSTISQSERGGEVRNIDPLIHFGEQGEAIELGEYHDNNNQPKAADEAEALQDEKRARKRAWLEEQDEMKFSHSIQFNAVPDWSSHYIAYSNLKKL